MKTALIIGASGLTGKECLYQLLECALYQQVIALVRKPLTIKHPKLVQISIDFDQLTSVGDQLKADDIFCCIGTTIKKAGSQEAFRKVDYEYPLEIAKAAFGLGAQRFMLMSAAGASAHSSIFYSRVKGELEQAIAGIGFSAFHIFRPSMLLGNRTEFRAGEWIGKIIMQVTGILFIGPLKAFKAIPALTVARSMVKAAKSNQTGVIVHSNREMLGNQ